MNEDNNSLSYKLSTGLKVWPSAVGAQPDVAHVKSMGTFDLSALTEAVAKSVGLGVCNGDIFEDDVDWPGG